MDEPTQYEVDHWGRITCIGFSDDVKEGDEYTPSGQIKRSVDGNGNADSYRYNSQRKVSARTDQAGDEETFRYDEEGLRHEMRENGQLLRFVYHKGQLLYGGGIEEKSYHLGYGIDAVECGAADLYYHRDEQLSTALITGEDGVVEDYYQYDAFGILLENGGRHGNRIGYTGQQYDGVTGQYYLRARYYNSQLGRFLQADSYLGDGLNLYAYCSNNPTMYYDPSGYAMTDEDYAKIKYDTDGSGYAYYQNNDYNNGLNQKGPSPFYEGAAGFQAHHMLQRKWAEANLSDYGYDKGKAPTISLGTGRTGIDSNGNIVYEPHNYANGSQLQRWRDRGKQYDTTLNSELVFGATDLIRAGLSENLDC